MTKSRQPLHGSPRALILAVFLLLTVLLLLNWAACAAQGSELEGEWLGFITQPERIRVELTVKPTMECELHYGSPRSCGLVAESTGSDDNLYYFKFKEASGGFCDDLFNQEMTLRVNPEGTVTLRVWAKDKGIDESVELKKQN
jgi:hypothetical protein